MPRYVKKPVEVDAMQATGREDVELIVAWITSNGGRVLYNPVVWDNGGGFLIDTLEGSMLARRGDFIIKGVNGEFYPCKPDIFEATYEVVA